MFKKKKSRALNLTPLIDVMTTLIIFILIQSSDSEVRVEDQLELSNQNYGDTVKENEQLEVSLDGLKLREDLQIKFKNGKFNDQELHKEEKKLVVKLFSEIEKLRREKEENGEKLDLNLSIDKRTPVDAVKKIIYTVTVAGVDNIFYLGEKKND